MARSTENIAKAKIYGVAGSKIGANSTMPQPCCLPLQCIALIARSTQDIAKAKNLGCCRIQLGPSEQASTKLCWLPILLLGQAVCCSCRR